ncbi:MAG: zinc-binding dehydrogenase [Proteobacteria bacterium]|nr:zinc-binding dehydrogenase [Pseudomonadota bacterium]MCZ6781834.1 zinc-binding dehydrogenase [Pseudomonadota bacterium]
MLAAVMRDSGIVLDTVSDPEPGSGEVLVKTLACGICGSDLHALRHADKMLEAAAESGAGQGPGPSVVVMDPSRDVVLGHEFCAEIVDFGPNTTKRLKAGTRVVSVPLAFRGTSIHAVGYSNELPGGYGEAMVLSEPLLLEVPNGLSTERAALTEPMAVGAHAVAKSGMGQGDAALVVGCGPVGLAVIAALRMLGVEAVVAADYSPMRRRLAEGLGAHRVVDPAERPAIDALRELAPFKPAVMFECVGVPGVIQQMMKDAPRGARIVVAGVCMEVDSFKPMIGINKELSLQFVLGYMPDEFANTLRAIAEGEIDVDPLITGRVGLEGVAGAFEDLARPDEHAKILVQPHS